MARDKTRAATTMFTYDDDTTEPLIVTDDDYQMADEFDYGETRFSLHVETGRDWEPETEGQINVIPHMVMEVSSGTQKLTTLVTLRAGPVVTFAARTTEDLDEFCTRLLDSIEEDMEGIESVEILTGDDDELAVRLADYGNGLG